MASRRGRHPGFAHPRTHEPPDVRFRTGRYGRAAGFGSVDPGLPSPRRARRGLEARSDPDPPVRWARGRRRPYARGGGSRALPRILRVGRARLRRPGAVPTHARDRRPARDRVPQSGHRADAGRARLGTRIPATAVRGRVRGREPAARRRKASETEARQGGAQPERDPFPPRSAAAQPCSHGVPARDRRMERRAKRAASPRACGGGNMSESALPGDAFGELVALATALAIGLLIGVERERSPTAKAGLRTFALVTLFGALSAIVAQHLDSGWVIGAGVLAVGAMIVAAYHRDTGPDADPGTTTVIALLVAYLLGVLTALGERQIAVMIAIATTVLLYFKPEMRGALERFSRRDLLSVLQFGVITFIVLPFLPDHGYGPYGALNPYRIWLMVVLVSGIGLAGYIALRLVGGTRGALYVGFFGGLVSSTATTLAY